MSEILLIDDPAPFVRRLTLNRPEKRNAISNALRSEIHDALQDADRDDSVRVSIIRGAGVCFSSGYDLKSSLADGRPYYTAPGAGDWSRHVTVGWTAMWDLAKPVVAQVHGYAMAGATELMAACDLVYLADDTVLTYPVVRVLSPPDFQFHPWIIGMRQAMELMLTGDAVDADEAVRMGMANRTYPAAELDEAVIAKASRIASIPSDILQINKQTVHWAMDHKGTRTGLRGGANLQGLASNLEATQAFRSNPSASVKQAASEQ